MVPVCYHEALKCFEKYFSIQIFPQLKGDNMWLLIIIGLVTNYNYW